MNVLVVKKRNKTDSKHVDPVSDTSDKIAGVEGWNEHRRRHRSINRRIRMDERGTLMVKVPRGGCSNRSIPLTGLAFLEWTSVIEMQ